MRNLFLRMKLIKSLLFCAVFGILFSAFAQTAQAQTTTFASFTQIGATRPFVFTNNSPTVSGSFNTSAGGAQVRFFYDETIIANLNPALQGQQTATLTMTSSTTIPGSTNLGDIIQPIQTVTIAIIRNTAAPAGIGTGTRRNLLTITVTTGTPNIGGTINGGSATLSASTPGQNVVFSSDFLNFGATTSRDFGISLSGASPVLTLGANNFLSSTGFNGVGTFASNPVPTVIVPPPTAAGVTIGGRVLTPTGGGLSGARVNLTDSNGVLRTIITNPFGYYRFVDVASGQTAILTVDSKRYTYMSQVINVTEDITDLNFSTADR